MSKISKVTLAVTTSLIGLNAPVFAAEPANATEEDNSDSRFYERIQILGSHDKLRTQGGATSLVSEAELEKFEFDDINKILATVPGINIREEDGYGLRPNIGFRGATPERSKKISLMEDGVLISPAPYSAPSAYYFPMVSRMTAVEVFKGPAAIKYGPNTVAGALNLVTREVHDMATTALDIAYGSDQYGKIHAYHGNTNNHFGYLIEGLYTRADGFKTIDFSEQTTGFEKSDVMAKFNYDFSQGKMKNFVELKLAYATEQSDETYLGLTREDLAANPYRRYAASQNDQMNWDHDTIQLTHYYEQGAFDITTRIYQHNFARDWAKVSSFGANTPSLLDVLINPTTDTNQSYYQILTGTGSGEFILGTNDRSYRSRGIQSDLGFSFNFMGLEHKLDAGVRLHQDYINRDHFEETYAMAVGGQVTNQNDKTFTTVNQEKSDAVSVYIQDTVTLEALTLTAGVRGEFIDSHYINGNNELDYLKKDSRIWLPSVSAFYKLDEDYGVFAGIHEGYVPSSPQQNDENVEAEKSINYEVGFRFNNNQINGEIVGFFNDYSNLKESCSFSQSSNCELDADFNGGDVNVFGIEAHLASRLNLTSSLDMPWSITYSYINSEFQQSFNSDYPQWGKIIQGDSMPYQPDHSFTLTTGLTADDWQVNLQAKYTGEMQEAAGDGVNLSGSVIEAQTIFDLSASYFISSAQSVYLKVDNITDEINIISSRPNGARPGKPRMFVFGYKVSL
ncbi:TonB-dependent receptor family protein [Catenovulum agarivorans]|uniref:TonB-dependent receptor family protein n=1 Tax=Catenovulum agarivorans TaxID=1172192 RepID=UPI00031F1B92|nr:TonB-dependent receptor [Catenovulum agarivorans]